MLNRTGTDRETAHNSRILKWCILENWNSGCDYTEWNGNAFISFEKDLEEKVIRYTCLLHSLRSHQPPLVRVPWLQQPLLLPINVDPMVDIYGIRRVVFTPPSNTQGKSYIIQLTHLMFHSSNPIQSDSFCTSSKSRSKLRFVEDWMPSTI